MRDSQGSGPGGGPGGVPGSGPGGLPGGGPEGVADSLEPGAILEGLTTQRLGRQIEHHQQIGSTNDRAKGLARAGAPEGLLVVAEEQTAGRGRLGRTWVTPRGSALAMSLVLRPALPLAEAPRLTLAAAVAVADAVRDVTGLPAGIKWPNDLQLGGRKFCGILTESEVAAGQVLYAVLGIGLNVNLDREAMDPALRETATSLSAELGRTIDRAPLVRAILERLEAVCADLVAGRFAARLLPRWKELSVTLGQPVRVLPVGDGPMLEGVAAEVDEEGALLVRLADGRLHRVVAGEVSIRPL